MHTANTARPARARPVARPLTAAQLRQLEADLRAEQRRLERSLGPDASRPAALALASRGSLPGGEASDDLAIAFHGRAHARYEAIVDALRRIDAGEYGRCAGCGDPIPFGRLLVMPESAHCVACGPRV